VSLINIYNTSLVKDWTDDGTDFQPIVPASIYYSYNSSTYNYAYFLQPANGQFISSNNYQ